ncbi:DUF6207 family protein [Streptomyces aquilus]
MPYINQAHTALPGLAVVEIAAADDTTAFAIQELLAARCAPPGCLPGQWKHGDAVAVGRDTDSTGHRDRVAAHPRRGQVRYEIRRNPTHAAGSQLPCGFPGVDPVAATLTR